MSIYRSVYLYQSISSFIIIQILWQNAEFFFFLEIDFLHDILKRIIMILCFNLIFFLNFTSFLFYFYFILNNTFVSKMVENTFY